MIFLATKDSHKASNMLRITGRINPAASRRQGQISFSGCGIKKYPPGNDCSNKEGQAKSSETVQREKSGDRELQRFREKLQLLPSRVSEFFQALPEISYDILGVTRGCIYYPATVPGEDAHQKLFWNRNDEPQSLAEWTHLYELIRDVRRSKQSLEEISLSSPHGDGIDQRWIILPIRIGTSLRGVVCLPFDGGLCLSFYSQLHTLLNQSLEEVALAEIAWQFSEQVQRRTEAENNISLVEKERREIAAELHDELGQSLTALQLQVSTLFTPDMDVDQVERLAQQASNQISEMLNWVRSLTRTLNPQTLKNNDLVTAIELMLAQFHYGGNIAISSDLEDIRGRFLPQPLVLAIYRIVQEATTNVIRYANANNLIVTVHWIDNLQMQIEIRDDGRGFIPSQNKQGNGLNNIRERAIALGGTSYVVSAPGTGTVVTAYLPLNIAAAEPNPVADYSYKQKNENTMPLLCKTAGITS